MTIYDKIARHYLERRADKSHFDYNRDIEVPAMIKLIGNVKDKVILDLGCGFGDQARQLSRKGAKKIIGLDLSKELIRFAQEQDIPRTKFEVGDLDKKLKYKSNHFDVVFSSLAISYIKNPDTLFKEVRRVLKKSGFFLLSTGHPLFNLINRSPTFKIEVKKTGKKRIVEGNYFDERLKSTYLGSIGHFRLHGYTMETLIQFGLRNGFELIDYKDAKPVPASQKYDPEKYKLTTTLPTFILFKWKKKYRQKQ